jgi:hypothetical protein
MAIAQPALPFQSRITEPFHPAPARLDSGAALPDIRLTQAAKRLYARLSRQHYAAASKGRQLFRARLTTLAADLAVNERTIRRGLDQLKTAGLVFWQRTGRSSMFQLRSLPEIVDNSPPDENQCPISSGNMSEPHEIPLKELKHNGVQTVDKSILAAIAARLDGIGFKLYQKGHRGPLPVDKVVGRFGVSWVLSWLDKAEDCGNSLRNPGAWLKKRLEASLRRQ